MTKKVEPQMILIGEKFATYLMSVGSEMAIVKMEDYSVPGRDNTRVYREYLAFRLGSRIGLPMPHTSLRQDIRYGRLSVQEYIRGATKPTRAFLERIVIQPLGFRIALFDILCGNHDRKPDNLLQLGTEIIPIDFNTAFQKTTIGSDLDQEIDMILARWFQIRGILSLTPAHKSLLVGEVRWLFDHLDDSFLHACLAEIPTAFCTPPEIEQVRDFLVERRDRLHTSVSKWWEKNIAPLHAFGEEALAMAIREHTRG
ncbi:MAG: hypothetical protein AB4372_16925 [Xenococcus sp. (in: cyanobacteria)]